MKKVLLRSSLFFLSLGVISSLSSCGSGAFDDGVKEIQNLVYNGSTITWDSVKNAKNYTININDGKDILVSQQTGKVSYEYDSKGEDFKFNIEAVVKAGSDKNPKYEIRFERLETVSSLNVVDGNLTWNYINNADSYEIMLGDTILNEKIQVNHYALNAGDFVAKVRPSKGDAEAVNGNNKYYSYWSEALYGTLLSSPTDLNYDSEKFTWSDIKGAESYVIKIGSETFTTNTNSYTFATSNEDLKISVKAVGNNVSTFDSVYSEEKKYSYIPAITGLTVKDGILVWNKPNNAVKYKIKINGIIQDGYLTEEKYDNLQAETSYRISILPIGSTDFFYSTWSNEQTINILRSPSISYNNNVLQWNQVTGASGYTLKIEKNGEVQASIPLGNEVFTYNYDFAEVGAYNVSIKATVLSSSNGVYESKYSNTYKVERLAAPSNIVVQNQPLEANQVMISCSTVAHASKYVLMVDGSEVANNTQPTFNLDVSRLSSNTNESIMNISIKSIGSVSATEAYLNSNSNAEFDITKLATPLNVKINGSQITWDSVMNTNKYIVTIDGKRIEVTSPRYTLTDLSSGNHTIYIQSMGDAEKVITSSYSNVLEITKLAQPNIKIEKDNSTGKYYLAWNSVVGATSYKVSVAGTNYDALTNRFDISGYETYFAEGVGSQVSVYAIGNGTNIINSDVSNTKTIVRYATPTNLKLTADSITWTANSIDSIAPNSYTVNIDGKEFVTTSPTYPLANIEAGSHSIKVKVNGDYNNTIDSPYTTDFYFTKLDEVSNIVKSGNKIMWDEIAGATGYQVKLSQDETYKVVTVPEIEVNYKSAGEFGVSIMAIGDNSTYANSNVKAFTQKVQAITQPVLSDDLSNSNSFIVVQTNNHLKITIHENANATAYKLIVGGRETTQTSNVFDYDMLDSNVDYEIQVQIIGNKFGEDGCYYISSNQSSVYKFRY